LCSSLSVFSIIAAIVYSLVDSLLPNKGSLSRTYERKLSAATEANAPLARSDHHQSLLATPISRQCLGAQDLQAHSPHRCVCTSLHTKRCSSTIRIFAISQISKHL
jgi:hypothetical protein